MLLTSVSTSGNKHTVATIKPLLGISSTTKGILKYLINNGLSYLHVQADRTWILKGP